LLLCIYIGIIVAVVLQIVGWLGLDLPNKWSLALISWLTEFIPYIGPLLWGIPAWLLALTHYGLWGFGIIFVLYWFIQWTENNILIPYVMNKTLGLSPIVIFLCVLLGGLVLGFVGVVIGVPLAVIITMIYDDNE
jgi:putative permease